MQNVPGSPRQCSKWPLTALPLPSSGEGGLSPHHPQVRPPKSWWSLMFLKLPAKPKCPNRMALDPGYHISVSGKFCIRGGKGTKPEALNPDTASASHSRFRPPDFSIHRSSLVGIHLQHSPQVAAPPSLRLCSYCPNRGRGPEELVLAKASALPPRNEPQC